MYRVPEQATFENKTVPLYTFEQLSQQPRLKLKNRAMDLRDLVGADRLPPLCSTGSVESVTRWIMETQCAIARAAGLGEMTPEAFGLPSGYGDMENGDLLHPAHPGKTVAAPRAPMQELVQGAPAEAMAAYEAAAMAAAATKARMQAGSNIFG